MYQSPSWPLYDSASPRDGWSPAEYCKCATAAKGDDFGALYLYLIDILCRFCIQLHDCNVSIKMFSIDVTELVDHVDEMSFDRIEVKSNTHSTRLCSYNKKDSNICDASFLRTHKCLESFFTMLKPKSENPHATLLLLYISAITETMLTYPSPHRHIRMESQGLERVKKYMTTSPEFVALAKQPDVNTIQIISHPDFVNRSANYKRLIDWDEVCGHCTRNDLFSKPSNSTTLRSRASTPS